MVLEIGDFLGYAGIERGLSAKTVGAYGYDLAKFSEFAKRQLGQDYFLEDIDPHIIKAYMRFLAGAGNEAIT